MLLFTSEQDSYRSTLFIALHSWISAMARVPLLLVLMGLLATGLPPRSGKLPSAEGSPPGSLPVDSLSRRPPEPIGQVRRDANGDAVPDRIGDTVVVAGRVTAEPGAVPVPEKGVGALQDGTGGVHIVLPDPLDHPEGQTLSRGDSARVWGVLRHRSGLAQVEGLGYEQVGSSRRVPDPIPLSVPSAAGERHEGRLAHVQGTVTARSANPGGQYFVIREAEAANAQLTVFVASRHAERVPIGQVEEGDEVAVTGIIGQYDLSYQILTRRAEDLSETGQVQAYLWWALLGTGGLGLASFTLIVFLRAAVRRRTRELEQSREELQEKENRFRSITENVSDGIYRLTPEEGIVYANQAFLDLFGYSSLEELREADPGELYADPPRRKELIEREARQGGLEGVEVRYQRKDGTTFVGLLSMRRVEGQNGEETYFDGAITDITERKQARQALQEERDRLDTLFESLPTPVVRCELRDRGAIITAANPAFKETFGTEFSAPEGKDINDLIVPAGKKDRATAIEQQALDEGFQEAEVKREVDGQLRDFQLQAAGRRRDGAPPELYVIYTDITERKAREKNLRWLREKYEGLLQGAPNAIFVADGETGRITEANQAAATLLGTSCEELVGRPFTEVHPPGKEALYQEVFERHMCPEDGVQTALTLSDGSQIFAETSAGETVPVEISATAIEVDGRSFGIAIFRDVTEQKRREEALRERQEKIEALYESTRRLLQAGSREEVAAEVHWVLQDVFAYPFGHTAFVEDGTIVPRETTAGGNYDMPRPEPRPVGGGTIAARALEAGEAVVVSDTDELNNDLDYGDLRSAAGVPIGSRGVVIVGKAERGDFSRPDLRLLEVLGGYAALVLDRLRREKALRTAKEQAEAAQAEAEKARDEAQEAARLKSAFLANMSHEIRTPLTSIIGFAETLGTEVEELELPGAESLTQQARLIEEGGKRLMDTLEGVLNLSKLEAGQMELDEHPVDLAAQIQHAAEELRPKAEEAGIVLKVEEQRSSIRAGADEGGVQIVLRNLLSNAIKYTKEGGTVWVRGYRENGTAVLEVQDTGIGMKPEVAEDLFESFRQASEGLGREYEGTGVGLAVTRKAAEGMGGSVEVETEKGEGSRFTVRLPQAEEGPSS